MNKENLKGKLIIFIPFFLISLFIILTIIYPAFGQPSKPDNDLHYNYGVIKKVDGIWYKTTYFGFEDDIQSISVYYGSELYDYTMDNINEGDYVIVVWKYVNTRAETFNGWITVKWLESLVKNGNVVFP